MNDLYSGAIGQTIQILPGERIYLPDILDLKGKNIKAIDYCDALATSPEGNAIMADGAGLYLNLMKAGTKNLFVKDFPLTDLAVSRTKGQRVKINEIIDLINSFIYNPTNKTGYIYLVFWFDEPKISNVYQTSEQSNYESFEVVRKSENSNIIPFDENRTLYAKQVRNLFLSISGGSVTPSGRIIAGTVYYTKMFITLQLNNYKYIRQVPLYLFNQISNYEPIRLQNVVFDFNNSYLELAKNETLEAGVAFLISEEYKRN